MFQSVISKASKTAAVAASLAVGVTLGSANVASALPVFTFNPSSVGLNGATITADNLVISDFSTVVLTPNGSGGANFTDTGVLPVVQYQLGATALGITGLNTSYGLYFGFDGTGTQNTSTLQSGTNGVFTTLNFTLYGYNITGPVTYLPSNTTPTGVVAPIALATGSLVAGGVGATTIPGVAVVPNANTLLTFMPTAAGSTFFQDPNPFYQAVFAAFTNNPSQVQITANGFIITQGGGSANFLATPTPEPASLALLGVGMVALGAARRRMKQ
jgi:hypothetical protein